MFQSQWGRVPSQKGKKSRELLGEWGNGERPYCPGDAMSLSCKMGSLWVRDALKGSRGLGSFIGPACVLTMASRCWNEVLQSVQSR